MFFTFSLPTKAIPPQTTFLEKTLITYAGNSPIFNADPGNEAANECTEQIQAHQGREEGGSRGLPVAP